jgi:alcohol dehydrogenase
MKALVYHGPGKKSWEEKLKPLIVEPSDAILKVLKTTICGTDLHIMKGDVPAVTDGRILGHEGVGIIEETGNYVTRFKKGDHVLISCITSCGKCEYCRRAIYSHCVNGGWILGNLIDGTQAEYVRIPYADNSLYSIPPDGDEEALVMLSDILPIGFECGVLNGKVKPGDTIAIVGAGPIGMAALLTAQLLFKNVQSGKLNPKKLITHHYKLEQIIQAYDTFEHASKEKALKIILTNQESVC